MPRREFTQANKKVNPSDVKRLNLEQGERARINLLEKAPLCEYTHTLEKVVMDDYGNVKMKTLPGFNGRPGRTVPDRQFIGMVVCNGDFDTVDERGTDPDNCPACKKAEESDAFDKPKPRYAINVLKYVTKPGSYNVQDKPFQATVLPWVFGPQKFDMITDLSGDYDDIRKIDLNIGPCENKSFQKYNIVPANGNAAFLKDAQRKELYKELLSSAMDDLTPMLGRVVSNTEMERMMREVIDAWNAAYPSDKMSFNHVADDSFDLDHSSKSSHAVEEDEEVMDDDQETMSSDSVADEEEVDQEEEDASEPEDDSVDLEDLLKGL